MQISFKPVHRAQSGFALLTMLAFLVVSLIVFGSIMYMITSNAKVTEQNNTYNMNQAAAEGVAETVIGQMDRDFLYQSLNSISAYTSPAITQTNWPVKFSFSDTNGNLGQVSVSINPQNWSTNWVGLNSEFTNLFGAVANCQVVVTAYATNRSYQSPATISESFQLAAIPVFQYGAFYNMDMDFSPGQPLTMNGKVQVNGMLYMCPGALATFNGSVAASLLVTNGDDPNDQQNLTFSSANVSYQGGAPISGVDSLTMPIGGPNANPTNVENILNLPPAAQGPPNAAAYAPSNQIYLYNEVDLIVSNSVTGINASSVYLTNLTVYYQNSLNTPYLTLVTNDAFFVQTNGVGLGKTYVTNKWYTFLTNVVFYDYREQNTVQAVQLDVGKLQSFLTTNQGKSFNNDCFADKGHGLDSIYIYNNAPASSSQLPAVRVKNGAQLPFTIYTSNPNYTTRGLTVVTAQPIYVWGDYNIKTNSGGSTSSQTTNTAYTYPAAFMADAITVLSSGWTDGGGNLPNASSTTVNAACLEGIVPSTSVGGTKHYSGGLENFLRLLENWNNQTLCYNGSIVVMFPSIYGTNFWVGPGSSSPSYYNVPTRLWGFDANFTQQAKLPPLTPQAKAVVRGQWDAQ